MTLAIILGRVSTEDQAEDGTGLPGQIEAGIDYITRRGYTLDTSVGFATPGIEYVPGVFQEDYTGRVIYRPAVNHLLDAFAQRPIKVVVVHRTSRLGRRGSVQEALENIVAQNGAHVEYVTAQFDSHTPMGRAMRRMTGIFDELDYEQIIEQLKQGKRDTAKRGSMVGSRPPYGFRFVRDRDEHDKPRKFLEIYTPEAAIRELLYVWYVFGDGDGKAMTLMQIARKLTRDGVPTRTDWRRRKYADGVWGESTVRELLKSEVSIGTWHYGKKKRIEEPNSFYANGKPKVRYVPTPRSEWIAISIPAIVNHELWQTAQERLSENKAKARRNRKSDYLFASMATCEACKSAYIGNHGERGYERRFYVCRGHSRIADKCTMPVFREREIDMVVWPWIKEIATHFERVEAALQQQQTETGEQNTRINALIANTDRLIADKKEEQARVLSLFKKGKLPEDRWEVEDGLCQREIASHQADREKLVAKLVKPHYTAEYLADIRAACGWIAEGIEYFDIAQKRETYELLELSLRLEVKDGYKAAHAECVLGKRLLTIGKGSTIVSTTQLCGTSCKATRS